MSGFRVRIELQGASQGDYVLLDRRLAAAGYQRAAAEPVAGGRRPSFAIPVPVYEFESAAPADQVRDHAKRIADTVTKGGQCQVTPLDRTYAAFAKLH